MTKHDTAPAPHVEVPEGWQLVPKIPTTEMECAPDHEDCPTPDAARAAYLAILASAPPSPLGIVTVPVIHPIQKEISTAPIPPCPFCDCNDDVISLRDQLRDAQMAIRLARPYVEDRLHRIDGEIDGAVALLLSSLDAASPAPAPHMTGEMIEAACAAIMALRGYEWPSSCDEEEQRIARENMSAAIKAAIDQAPAPAPQVMGDNA